MNDFYQHKSVEELMREQGVTLESQRALFAEPWSDEEDEEVNAFLAMRREYDVPHRSKIEDDEEARSLLPAS